MDDVGKPRDRTVHVNGLILRCSEMRYYSYSYHAECTKISFQTTASAFRSIRFATNLFPVDFPTNKLFHVLSVQCVESCVCGMEEIARYTEARRDVTRRLATANRTRVSIPVGQTE